MATNNSDWRCVRDVNIRGPCLGACPQPLQLEQCRARCATMSHCRSIVANKYGQCFLKKGVDIEAAENRRHETVSCIRHAASSAPRSPRDLILAGPRPYRRKCTEPDLLGGSESPKTCWDCLTGAVRGLGSCEACAAAGFDCRCSCPVPPQSFGGFVISGDRANASSASRRRFEEALSLCATLGIRCTRIPAVYLTTNGKGRCGPAGDALRGEARGTVGLHLAHQDAWATVASGEEPAFVFEDDAALPQNLPKDRARALLHGLTSDRDLDLLKLGHWQHTCNHAYFLTPRAAARLLAFSKPRACGVSWRSDGVTGHLCWSTAAALRCANAGPDLPNTRLTRFDGIVKLHRDLTQYRHDVRGSTLIIGNGRSVLHSNVGHLVDNYGSVVRFNDYQTEGFGKHVGTKTTLWVLSDWV